MMFGIPISEIVLFPLYCFGVLTLYLFIKPPSKADLFFSYNDGKSEKVILDKLAILQDVNGQDYSKFRKSIRNYYADHIITEWESTRLERIVMLTYFNGFHDRWIAFKKSDPFVLTFFFLMIAYGFIYMNLGVYLSKIPNKTPVYLLMNATIIAPALLSMLMLGICSLALQFLSMFGFKKGSVMRAHKTFDEFIKAFKPGGRNTEVILGGPDTEDVVFWV